MNENKFRKRVFTIITVTGAIAASIAVPCTATLMLFYEDWKRKLEEEAVQT